MSDSFVLSTVVGSVRITMKPIVIVYRLYRSYTDCIQLKSSNVVEKVKVGGRMQSLPTTFYLA